MIQNSFAQALRLLLNEDIDISSNFIRLQNNPAPLSQLQTNDVFSDKWHRYSSSQEQESLYAFQKDWFLTLYGFASVSALKEYLSRKHVILDAGCGLGYKAAWFAELAPHALVIGMDYSEAAGEAALKYRALPNLFFAQGDIAATKLKEECVDFVCCDQVIMHTQVPKATFIELARITARDGEIACYFYAKKALPRELLDDHFRSLCTKLDRRELWEMSEQLTELGKRLTELNVEVDVPAIPALGIRGGRADLQRFLYWNFLKCFWNPTLGFETSVITNFDWYSPSNAQRFSEQEVRAIVSEAYMRAVYFHVEEACYAGRFAHASE